MDHSRIDWFDVEEVDALDKRLSEVVAAEYSQEDAYAFVDQVTVDYVSGAYVAKIEIEYVTQFGRKKLAISYHDGSKEFVAGMFLQALIAESDK